jgi:hypothetical protein
MLTTEYISMGHNFPKYLLSFRQSKSPRSDVTYLVRNTVKEKMPPDFWSPFFLPSYCIPPIERPGKNFDFFLFIKIFVFEINRPPGVNWNSLNKQMFPIVNHKSLRTVQ